MKKSEHFYCKLLNFKVLQKLVEDGPYWNKLIGDKNTKANIIKAKLPDNVVLELTEFQGFKKKFPKMKIFGVETSSYAIQKTMKEIKKNTRRYAKRQITWLKSKKNIVWIKNNESALKIITNYLDFK